MVMHRNLKSDPVFFLISNLAAPSEYYALHTSSNIRTVIYDREFIMGEIPSVHVMYHHVRFAAIWHLLWTGFSNT